ncbi:MAG: hypothetical protein IPG39_01890 [Bacteroidetes bacterium]|nr:hypothetical protein [Bacteroidota bacterium]
MLWEYGNQGEAVFLIWSQNIEKSLTKTGWYFQQGQKHQRFVWMHLLQPGKIGDAFSVGTCFTIGTHTVNEIEYPQPKLSKY